MDELNYSNGRYKLKRAFFFSGFISQERFNRSAQLENLHTITLPFHRGPEKFYRIFYSVLVLGGLPLSQTDESRRAFPTFTFNTRRLLCLHSRIEASISTRISITFSAFPAFQAFRDIATAFLDIQFLYSCIRGTPYSRILI